MTARITYTWGKTGWYSYIVSNLDECKDEMDRSLYSQFLKSNDKSLQLGKICIERL